MICCSVNHIRVFLGTEISLDPKWNRNPGISLTILFNKSGSSRGFGIGGIFLTQYLISAWSIKIKFRSLLEQRMILPKNSISNRSCPLASSLKVMAVLRFLIFSLSSFRLLSKDSSMPITNFEAQSLLKVLLISDMELKVMLWPKMFFNNFRKVDFPVLFSLEIRLRIGRLW